MFSRLGLRWRLSLSILGMVAIFAAFFGFTFPREQEAAAVRGLERQGRSLALILSAATAKSMESEGTRLAISDAVESAGGADPDVDYIVALSKDGEVVARYESGLIGRQFQHTAPVASETIQHTDDHVHVSVSMMSEDKNVGTLTVGMSRRQVVTDKKQAQMRTFWLSLAIRTPGAVTATGYKYCHHQRN